MIKFTSSHRLVTGLSGLVGGLLSVLMVALYFVYSGPPPVSNVLGRNLITVVTFTGFMIFAVGLQRMLRAAGRGDAGMAGTIATTALLSYVAITFVATSLEVGTSLQYPDGSKDPTFFGPLANGMALLHGPVARILVATFLIALTAAVAGPRLLPKPVQVGNIILAIVNIALIPSLFFGMNPANFYAANGWGTTASIGAINVIWFAVLGASVLRVRIAPAEARTPEAAIA
jgi:hypothetical protein